MSHSSERAPDAGSNHDLRAQRSRHRLWLMAVIVAMAAAAAAGVVLTAYLT